MQSHQAPVEEKTNRRRKIQAVMAGGVVLGIGAVVTLAAWNDSEFAIGEFGAGSFNLESSTDGSTFDDHASEGGAAQLDFQADNIIPGETVYAPFSVRLDAATTVDGAIEEADGIEIVTAEGTNIEYLSYTVYAEPDSCDESGATSGTEVATGADLSEGVVGSTSTIELSAGTNGEPGEAVHLCFVVNADTEDLEQGGTTEATWEVLATSLEG